MVSVGVAKGRSVSEWSLWKIRRGERQLPILSSVGQNPRQLDKLIAIALQLYL